MCANVGTLRVFNRMPICDVAWSAMIMAYVLMQARAAGIGTSLTNATEAG
jgi:hypothetical protein